MSATTTLSPRAVADIALEAVRAYEEACEGKRQRLSTERCGWRGAHVPEASPTEEGRRAAIESALSPYFGAPQ